MAELLCDPTATAVFSEDRVYRYRLVRATGLYSHQIVNFVGLNPSTADETTDDPTVRRLIGFARDWGYGRLVLTNLFAFRATDPRRLREDDWPTGPLNDEHLTAAVREAGRIVLCWGAHGTYLGRGAHVRRLLAQSHPWVFGLCKNGEPMHPLYLSRDVRPWPLDWMVINEL